MPTRAFSIEDGNIGSKSIITAKKLSLINVKNLFI